MENLGVLIRALQTLANKSHGQTYGVAHGPLRFYCVTYILDFFRYRKFSFRPLRQKTFRSLAFPTEMPGSLHKAAPLTLRPHRKFWITKEVYSVRIIFQIY